MRSSRFNIVRWCGAVSLVLLSTALPAQQKTRSATGAKPVAGKPTPVAKPASAARMPMLSAVDTMLLHGMKYRLAGHSVGGRVTAVTGVPNEPRTFYMGAASGGVFRTTNGGESWTPITDGKMPVGSVGSIAVANSDSKIIYVGTGSDGVR
ncbi:MAG: hypothetical protein ABJC26_13480, partial [Gemmatimonadaceae bacterium]